MSLIREIRFKSVEGTNNRALILINDLMSMAKEEIRERSEGKWKKINAQGNVSLLK